MRFERRNAPDEAHDVQAWVPLLELLEASDEQILREYGRWYVPNRDAMYVRRNALVALGNIGDGTDPGTIAVLARYLSDPSAILRAHAVWSAARLRLHHLLPATDPDDIVVAELVAERS